MRGSTGIVIFLLIFSPLAFGTVEPWSLAVMEFLSLLALFFFLYGTRRQGEELYLHEVPGLVPLFCFLGYILLQLVPLPPGVLKAVSPGTYSLYKETLWAADPNTWGSLSFYKKATVSEFFRFAAYAALYILTIQILTNRDLLKRIVTIMVIFTSVLAFFSMLQHFLWNKKIYWLRELTMGGSPFGPYVNRNHYAGLVDMVLPLMVCLFIYYRPRYVYRSLRERAAGALGNPLTNVHVLLGFSSVLVATSVFLSLSRGGIMSLFMSMILLAGMIRNNKRKEGKGWILVVVIVMLVFYSVGWFGWDQIFDRFKALRDVQGDFAELRLGIWKDSLSLMKDFPLTGTGLGSYGHIYPKYRSLSAEGIIDHAHNDYLELFSEGGVIAFSIMFCFFATVILKSYRVYSRRRDRYSALLYIGVIAGIVSMLIHSITDFNLHIGANGLYLFFLAGLAVSAANTRIQGGRNNTLLGKAGPATNRVVAPALAVLLCSVIFNTGDIAGRFGLSLLREASMDVHTPKETLEGMRTAAYRTSLLDSLNGAPHYVTARIEWLLSDKNKALEAYRKAIRRNPLNSEYLQTFGLVMARLGQNSNADGLLRGGIRSEPSNPLRYKTYALWLLSSDRREEGIQCVKKAITLEPGKTRDYIAMLVLAGFHDRDIRDALPQLAEPHLLFADYLYKTGNDTMTIEEYHTAMDYVKNDPERKPAYFYQAYHYFMKRGLFDDALAVMRKAEEELPRDVGIKMTLAGMYEKAGIPYRAKEEYRKVLLIEPENRTAKKKLEEIQ